VKIINNSSVPISYHIHPSGGPEPVTDGDVPADGDATFTPNGTGTFVVSLTNQIWTDAGDGPLIGIDENARIAYTVRTPRRD
jgi:hypothetical protein